MNEFEFVACACVGAADLIVDGPDQICIGLFPAGCIAVTCASVACHIERHNEYMVSRSLCVIPPSCLLVPYPMDIIVNNQDTYILEPNKEPVLGWRVRPGTFRVAVPYDRSSQPPRGLSDEERLPQSGQRKKRKLAQKGDSLDSGEEEKLAQWISSELQTTLNQPRAIQFIRDMRSDEFYRAGSLESEDSSLDFVQLQPTLQMMKSGFSDISSKSESDFGELCLCESTQSLDLGDIYETLVVNTRPTATVVNILAENTPKYLVPPRSAFIISDLEKIRGLISIGIVQLPLEFPAP